MPRLSHLIEEIFQDGFEPVFQLLGLFFELLFILHLTDLCIVFQKVEDGLCFLGGNGALVPKARVEAHASEMKAPIEPAFYGGIDRARQSVAAVRFSEHDRHRHGANPATLSE